MSVDRKALTQHLVSLTSNLPYPDDYWGSRAAVQEQLDDCAQAVVELVEVIREIREYQRSPEYAWLPRTFGQEAPPPRVVIRRRKRDNGVGRWVVTLPAAVAWFVPHWAAEPCVCETWDDALRWACGVLKYATREAEMQCVGPPVA